MRKVYYIYNPKTRTYDRIYPTVRQRALSILRRLFVGMGLGAGSFIILLLIFGSPSEKELRIENARLLAQYNVLSHRLDEAMGVMQDIQQRDDNLYRVVLQADPVSDAVRKAGYGGTNRYEQLRDMANADLVINTTQKLDMLNRQLYIQSKSFDEVVDLCKSHDEMLKCIPAIQPVSNKDLKKTASGYGVRIDPIYKTTKFHAGMDFSASPGTPVYATGDGVVVKTVQSITGLPDYYFAPDKLEAYKDANLLKGGLVYADAITTVSPTYAEEIKTSFYGEGLEGLMNARANDLWGIVNGLDYNDWNPDTDYRLAKNFNISNFRRNKPANKMALQEELGLDQDSHVMLIGIVSRLTDQKGFDLIDYMMDEMCQDAVQIAVLGTGDPKYENMFRHFAWKYSGKVSANIFYSDDLSHRFYAGCDAFLMPSLFEPCGLSQLMSLRYGTLPIVRETGGLKDTVEPYNEFEKTGTGFSFTNYNAHEMLNTVRYAERIYYDKKRDWNKIVERAMSQDFSWQNSARQYEELYKSLIGE